MSAIRLPDGRNLNYAEYGALDGRPLFFLHGTPGSRYFCHPDDSIAATAGVRIIVPDRPGMGLSDFRAGLTLRSWVDDLLALVDALSVRRYAVVGYSGGGPFAAVCGIAPDPRLASIGLINGVGPLSAPAALDCMLPTNRMGYQVASWMPWGLWRAIFRLYYGGIRDHPEKLARMSAGEPQADWAIFALPGVREMFVRNFSEAFRQGTDGVAWEGWLLARPWGFRLEDIAVPTFLWQGLEDVIVTPAMGRYLANRIPGCQAQFLPGEGHLCFIKHWRSILDCIIGTL